MRKYEFRFLLALSQGFDRGNYGNAYESQDYDAWIARQETPARFKGRYAQAYRAGMLIGFFSSYEDSEIPESELDRFLQTYAEMQPVMVEAEIATREE